VAAVAERGRDETLGWESAAAAATGARVGRREDEEAAAATRGGLGNFSGGVPDSGNGLGGAPSGADGFGAPDFGRDFSSLGNFCASGGFVNFVGVRVCGGVLVCLSRGGGGGENPNQKLD
jgi:hypothetical protein